MRGIETTTGSLRRAAGILMVCIALSALAHGCAAPTAPPPPPGGGTNPTFSFARFQSAVEPALTRRGCDAGGDCHGGGIRGTFELSPPGAKDAKFDFGQAVLQISISNPDASPILTMPLALAAGGAPHPYKAFATTGDSDYVAIRAWILAGVNP